MNFFGCTSYMEVSTFGCNYFLIIEIRPANGYNLPDEMNFLSRLEGSITPSKPPPQGVSALERTLTTV